MATLGIPSHLPIKPKMDLLIACLMGPNSVQETAAKFGFMVPTEAADLATRAGADKLAIIHIGEHSQRVRCLEETKSEFENVFAPSSGDSIFLSLRARPNSCGS